MEHFVAILVVCASLCRGEPLSEAMQRRSVYGVYADEFADEYEPVAVAAFPLHRPVPVLRLLSRAPLGSYAPHKRAAPRPTPPPQPKPQPQPQRDHRDQYVFASAPEPEYAYSYEQDSYEQPAYAPSATHSKYKYSSPASSYEEYEAPAPVVVYARPDNNGGYSYRHKPRPAKKPQEPVIIRVHKYKIIRD